MRRFVSIAIIVGLGASAHAENRHLSWVKVTDHANWQARDSAGEAVYKNRMWLIGGWFDSFQPAPRDVWSSTDGKNWQLVTTKAPWLHSDLAMSLAFQDKIWLMGGWYNGRMPGHSASNAVWQSADGAEWVRATEHAGWSPRLAAAVVEFRGRMWLLGGTEDYYFGDRKSLKNDVWSSADGREWKLHTANAGWSPRAFHQAVVVNDKIYLFGGGSYDPDYYATNDVWCSDDGEHWKQVAEHAAWSPRLWFSTAVYRDRMWVLGGWSKTPSKNWDDVWWSKDGTSWQEFKSEGKIWKARHEHSSYVFQDKLWIAGGHAWPLSNEVWSLTVPTDWFDN